ncbi:MAG: peptidase E [Actinobacteria bacterium]|nr:peptidase E [Actinomycetota bacterium]
MADRRIVAFGGFGLFNADHGGFAPELVRMTGKGRPRACFLPQASNEDSDYVVAFYEAFSELADCTYVVFSPWPPESWRERITGADIVFVGGGNTANMLAVWRVHGVPEVLREAWESGTVMCGSSAGMICWFEAGVTDSFGPQLEGMQDGLGFLPGSACPHYDGEERRRPRYHELVVGGFPGGYAADDGVGLVFQGTELAEAIRVMPAKLAYRVELQEGEIVETPIAARPL